MRDTAYSDVYNDLVDNGSVEQLVSFSDLIPKHHTIRAGHRWKVGDKFSPRVWSGKPYRSKQIQFAPEIEVQKIWRFEIDSHAVYLDGCYMPADTVGICANNDGLSFVDLMHWLRYPRHFTGQIICWNEQINY